MTDRLEEIKREARQNAFIGDTRPLGLQDIDWLIDEIERLRADGQASFENCKKERSQLARQISNLSKERKLLLDRCYERGDNIDALQEQIERLKADLEQAERNDNLLQEAYRKVNYNNCLLMQKNQELWWEIQRLKSNLNPPETNAGE